MQTLSDKKPAGRLIVLTLVLAAAAVGAGGWLAWRFTAPVQVRLAGVAQGVPLEIEISPATVAARPGQVISATYRIRNTELVPVAAFGRLEFEPPEAADQVQVFITECGGLNTYQQGQATDLVVVFRVQPAGLTGAATLTLRHTFVAASP